ncbi:response regulator transcription factor [Geodermatophilus sabuli]|uniref:Two component transcriptional regulator, LuxR family n=1 Tax=Geodermatophilus sabuli TaxID=1564158 RepID=A0A285EAF8_9ACTN|nr:response regulator transcription factor [Geodermatophilus sabuli]MBB3085457.1 DNA-binding NarL/FixJ family response regulator [Geodermatophilus sabuli]SNX96118.1 two component transcriptional regulator, LuxR family [Geodermatophilus sabuli]
MAEPEEPLRVAVVDDHPVYRDGLAVLLGSVSGLVVVGTAADGAEAVALAREEQPDVVVMDVQMPVLDGIEATRRITAESPSIGVVVLTMSEDDGTVFAAVRAGARGYLLKGADQEEVIRAITTVAGGGAVFGAALARRIGEFFAAGPTGPETAFPQLTTREREVLELVAAGRSNAQIAAALYLSPKTVRNNVSNVLTKLQVTDRAQAIVRAREAGLGR